MTAIPDAGTAREVTTDVFGVEAPFWGYALTQYLIRGPEWTMIDTGIATTPEEFVAPFMAEHGGIDKVGLVLGTHGHVDHVGGNGAMKRLSPKVRLTLPRRDIGLAESAVRHYLHVYKGIAPGTYDPDDEFEAAIVGMMGDLAAIDMPLEGGDSVPLPGGGSVETRFVGAHAPGHVVFVDRERDVAFIGDIIQGRGSVNASSGLRAFPMYTPVGEYRRGLAAVRELGVSTVCTAHEGVFQGEEIERRIDDSLAWSDEFDALLEEIVVRAGRPLDLAGVIDGVMERWPGYERVVQVHVTTLAHLDDLTVEGQLVPAMESGVKYWSAKA